MTDFGKKGDFGKKRVIETIETPLTEEDIENMPAPPRNSIVEPSEEFRTWWEEITGVDHRKFLQCQIVEKDGEKRMVSALRSIELNNPFKQWDFF